MMKYRMSWMARGLACLLLVAPLKPSQAARPRPTLNKRRPDRNWNSIAPEVEYSVQDIARANEEVSALEGEVSAVVLLDEKPAAQQGEPAANQEANIKNISMLHALALSRSGSEANESVKSVAAMAMALNNHLHEAARAACQTPPTDEEYSELTDLMLESRRCRHAQNPVLVIDGGSTGTRGALFKVQAESCPRRGRKMLPDSITFLEEGTKFDGLRQTMEKWLDANAGPDWASKAYDAKALLEKYPSMLEISRELMHKILDNAAELIRKYFGSYDLENSKSVGVPTLFFSTAGVRGTHDWFRRGLFTAFRQAINSYQGSQGILFFTNEEWARPIPGVEEGMLAFIAANQMLGNFDKAKELNQAIERSSTPEERKTLEREMHQSILSIVEVGGASAQIVFPVFALGSSPSFVNTINLTRANYLSNDYPSLDIMSTSYMQLGASSAIGVFYKSFCSNPKNLNAGVCLNPCLPKGYRQACSTGEVKINPDGTIIVAKDIQEQRVKPAVYYCTSSNAEIANKALNRLSCLAAGIDPEETLEKRLAIENCNTIEGTGDFEACSAGVSSILLDPPLPLPANQEASYTGFDTVGQIFDFMATGAPVVITGKAVVLPVMDLIGVGLLSPSFQGDACQLRDAAAAYCSSPIAKRPEGNLVLQVNVGGTVKEVLLTSLNVEMCFKLGLSHGYLRLLTRSKVHPSKIKFALNIEDPKTGEKMGEYGWPPGAILRAILDTRNWAINAYELGTHHTVTDRWDAHQHPENREVKQKSS